MLVVYFNYKFGFTQIYFVLKKLCHQPESYLACEDGMDSTKVCLEK